jgi:hypothetical protein
MECIIYLLAPKKICDCLPIRNRIFTTLLAPSFPPRILVNRAREQFCRCPIAAFVRTDVADTSNCEIIRFRDVEE